MNEEKRQSLLSALDYIDPTQLDYEDWLRVGFALDYEGFPSSVWDNWSKRDPDRYKPLETLKKASGFKHQSKNVTGNTIFYLAQQHGWINTAKGHTGNEMNIIQNPAPAESITETNKDIQRLKKILKGHCPVWETFSEPSHDWSAENDLVEYLNAVYKPNEIIGYNTSAKYDQSRNKWYPNDKGHFRSVYNVIGLIEAGLKVNEVIEGINTDAGAWIRINPLDGNGCANENVTAYRHTLIESDTLSLDEQIHLIYELRLPVSAIVYSGSKSIHAIVKIEADSKEQYDNRVSFMYEIADKYGLKLDKANKNEARLSRMAGIERNGHKQFLISTHIGCSSYEEWELMVRKGMQGIKVLDLSLKNPMPMKPALIEGLLRVSHKMMIAAPSKAGKTWLLMNLAISIATGDAWMNRKCVKGRVLYLNMEVDPASVENRFQTLCQRRHLEEFPKGIDVMDFRGVSTTLDVLADQIIDAVKKIGVHYDAIIIDPLYKTLKGDENSNSDMAEMGKAGDRLAEETGAALIYGHHFSKGRQAGKAAMDRASGAGSFARDCDALITMTPYDPSTTYGEKVFEVSYTVREFPHDDSTDMVQFDPPIFKIVPHSQYPDAQIEKKGKTTAEKNDDFSKVADAYNHCSKVTANNGERGVHKKVILDKIKELYPELLTGNNRTNEKTLIENNPHLKNVGMDGKNAVYQLTSSSPIVNDDME